MPAPTAARVGAGWRGLGLLTLVTGLSACVNVASERHLSQRTAAYTDTAGAPVNHFSYDGAFFSWEALGTRHLVLYTRPRQAWLLSFDGGCPYLDHASGIAVRSNRQQLSINFDRIVPLPGGLPCAISRIQPVDLGRFKASQARQRAVELRPRGA